MNILENIFTDSNPAHPNRRFLLRHLLRLETADHSKLIRKRFFHPIKCINSVSKKAKKHHEQAWKPHIFLFPSHFSRAIFRNVLKNTVTETRLLTSSAVWSWADQIRQVYQSEMSSDSCVTDSLLHVCSWAEVWRRAVTAERGTRLSNQL